MSLRIHRTTLAAACLCLLPCACEKKGEVHHYQVAKEKQESTPPPKTATTPSENTPSYHWSLPDGWSAKPASGMRLATIVIPVNGKQLDASVTEFGGNLASNINRWRGQLGMPTLGDAELIRSLDMVDTGLGKGYIVALNNESTPEKSMLAAIIPRPTGTSVFVKINGSADELNSIATPFRQFIQSLHQDE